MINWIKLSEIISEGVVQAFVSAGVILVTYYLGKMQSDREYKRRLDVQDKNFRQQLAQQRLTMLYDQRLYWQDRYLQLRDKFEGDRSKYDGEIEIKRLESIRQRMSDIKEEIETLEKKLSIPQPSPSGDITSPGS